MTDPLEDDMGRGLAEQIQRLQQMLNDARLRISSLEAKLADGDIVNNMVVPPSGALGGYAKTIGDMNYKTIGEMQKE